MNVKDCVCAVKYFMFVMKGNFYSRMYECVKYLFRINFSAVSC